MSNSNGPLPADVIAALQRGGIVEVLKVVLASKDDRSRIARHAAAHSGNAPVPHAGTSPVPHRSAPLLGKASDHSPGEVPRSNNDVWLLVFVIAALCIYYVFGR
jgi:hypothetical protein